MNMLSRFGILRTDRPSLYAALVAGVMLLSANWVAQADEYQEASQLFKQGQHGRALDKVNKALADKPKDPQARFLKGLILTEQGQAAEAIKTFSTLTEDYPELPEPYNNLAVLYASQGQFDKARRALEMAIRTHPSYATAHENLGDIYAKMASQAYDRALQLDRSNTATQTKLAMIQDIFASGVRGKPTPSSTVQAKAEPAPAPVEKAAPALKTEAPPAPVKSEVAAVQPVPAEKPAKPAPVANSSGEVLEALHAWAAAWSAQDVDKYLSFYAADFKVPGGQSRAAWEATRRQRLTQPKFIEVGISNAKVEFRDAGQVAVKFHQSYRASHMKASGKKSLVMVKAGGKWRIREENAQ